jgi:hypothetical protein
MNDEKYIFFTERIQNTLLRPEILKLMKDENERELDEKISLKGGMTIITKKKSDLTSTQE